MMIIFFLQIHLNEKRWLEESGPATLRRCIRGLKCEPMILVFAPGGGKDLVPKTFSWHQFYHGAYASLKNEVSYGDIYML